MKLCREPDRYAYVYTLCGPDEVVRYVGWAYNPYARLRIHLSGMHWPVFVHDTGLEVWLKGLLRAGQFPEVRIVSCHPDRWEAGKAERAEIDRRFFGGEPLTNWLIKGAHHSPWVRQEIRSNTPESDEAMEFFDKYNKEMAAWERARKREKKSPPKKRPSLMRSPKL